MKPKIKFMDGMWFCGGTYAAPWYIDWFSGETPCKAYENWKRVADLAKNIT